MPLPRAASLLLLLVATAASFAGCSPASDEGPSGGAGAPPGGANGPGGAGSSGSGDVPPGNAPPAGDRPPSSNPPTVLVPPIYPKDGYCAEPGVTWAWCADFDGEGTNGRTPFVPAGFGIAMQLQSHATINRTTCETSGNCAPYLEGGSLFLNAEDGGFGMNVLRVEQPFDFAGREGHIHYRSNMRGHGRMHQTVHIGPAISNSAPDLRFAAVLEALNMGPAIDIDFIGDGGWPFEITTWKGGQKAQQFHVNGPIGIEVGTGAKQHDVDFYVSRTRVRVALDGKEVLSQPLADLGFDRGYVHFAQLAYNPVKDGYVGEPGNRFLWDNLAFDGPSLAKNSLTPAGKQEVLFRAWDKGSCTVRGMRADGPVNPTNNFIFDTWHVQIGASDPPITLGDIQCVANSGVAAPYNQAEIGDIQVVKP